MTMQSTRQQVEEAADSVVSGFGNFWAEALARSDIWVNLAFTVAVVVVVLVLRRFFLNVLEHRVEDVRVRYRWGKGSAYAAFLAVTLFVLVIWTGGDLASLGTFLGLLTAGLAIALRDMVANVAGWLFILWRRPFDLGDRVQVGEYAGDVVDVRVLQFTILEIGNWVDADQSTGRIIHIPNQKVFSEAQANYTAQFEYLWNEVPVLVTFESDWRKAKGILTEIADSHAGGLSDEAAGSVRKASRKFLIFYQKLTPVVYTTVKDSGVMLTVRYLCKPRARRGTSEAIWEEILDRFGAEPDIDLAYPTQRLYYNQLEGKEGARMPLPGPLGGPWDSPGAGEHGPGERGAGEGQ